MSKITYTHKWLMANGFTRYTPKEHGEPGFFCYDGSIDGRYVQIAWVGNDATMNEWIEQKSNWEKRFPAIYKWYTDPTQKDPITDGPTTLIKGEDPMLDV